MINNAQSPPNTENPSRGRAFEQTTYHYFLEREGIDLSPDLSIPVAVEGRASKLRKFDLGSHQHKVLVECKNHSWTGGGNVPSAKMSVWNEAMYYFHAAPSDYKKVLFVPLRRRPRTGQSLAEYYLATYKHLIPRGVEIWEYDEVSDNCEKHEIN